MKRYFIYGFVEADDEEEARFNATIEGGTDVLNVESTDDETTAILELLKERLNGLTENERAEIIKQLTNR